MRAWSIIKAQEYVIVSGGMYSAICVECKEEFAIKSAHSGTPQIMLCPHCEVESRKPNPNIKAHEDKKNRKCIDISCTLDKSTCNFIDLNGGCTYSQINKPIPNVPTPTLTGMTGWICPKCGAGVSPFTIVCPCSINYNVIC